jgi:hypothetical protein
MPELVIDFSETQSFDPLPPGDYVVSVESAKPGKSTAGNPKVSLQVKVIEGEQEGRMLFDDLVLTGKGAFKIRQALKAFGLLDSDQDQVRLDSDDLVGCVGTVTVANEVWAEEDGGDGETRSRVKKYVSAGTDAAFEDIFSE